MTWQLRRAGIDDLAAIMAIETSTFPSDAWSESTMAAELSGQHGYYLVAHEVEEPHRVVGYAGLLAPRGAGDADVQTIAVAATAQRKGLGRTLMLALLAEAQRRSVDQVFLEVRADNDPAATLYRTLGFEEIGVRPRYYQPDGVDAVVMRRRSRAPQTTVATEEAS